MTMTAGRSSFAAGRRPRRAAPGAAAFLAVPLFLLPLAACSNESASGKAGAPVPQGVPVSAAPVIRKAVPVQVRVIGNVQASSTVSVKSQVDGQIQRVHFTEGQEVRKGDILFTLDPRPFEAALRQAEGNLGRDRAMLQQAEANLAQKQAEASQAEANLARDEAQVENARMQVRRYQALIDDGAISQEQYDQVRTTAATLEAAVRAARAALDNARAGIRWAQAAVESARAAIRADEAAVENARIQLGYTIIRSPMDGRTGNLLAHPGNTVKARDEANPLVVINQVHPIHVSFAVPEQHLADLRRYRAAGSVRVEAVIPGQEKEPARGDLTFVNNTVDPATGTIQLKATFANRDNRLWPGQFLNVILTLATRPDALVVPSQAIQAGQKGPYVFVITPDRTVESRPVVPGETRGDETVVERGLAAGERVVTEGQIRLVPGARVEVKPSAPGVPAPSGQAG